LTRIADSVCHIDLGAKLFLTATVATSVTEFGRPVEHFLLLALAVAILGSTAQHLAETGALRVLAPAQSEPPFAIPTTGGAGAFRGAWHHYSPAVPRSDRAHCIGRARRGLIQGQIDHYPRENQVYTLGLFTRWALHAGL
jgi:hypothetical protein